MNQELKLKIEQASKDRDFFIINKDAIFESYSFIEDILNKYVDICCMKFTSFRKRAGILGYSIAEIKASRKF